MNTKLYIRRFMVYLEDHKVKCAKTSKIDDIA